MTTNGREYSLENFLLKASQPPVAEEVLSAVVWLGHGRHGLMELNAVGAEGVAVEYIADAKEAVAFAQRHAGRLLLVGINPRKPTLKGSFKSATSADVAAVLNFFIDIEPDLPKDAPASTEQIAKTYEFMQEHLLPLLPASAVLEFSGRGFHALVALPSRSMSDAPEFPAQIRAYQHDLMEHLAEPIRQAGLRMDITADARRMLKLPGTAKPGMPLRSVWPVAAKRYEDADCADIIATKTPLAKDGAPIRALSDVPVQVPDKFSESISYYPMLRKLYEEPAGDRSERDWALAKELAKKGFSREETAAVLMSAPYNVAKDLGRHYLAYSIDKAYADVATVAISVTDAEQENAWLTTGEDLFSEPEVPIEFLVEGILPARDVGLVVGPPGSLKTWFTLELALAVGTGSAMLGKFNVLKPGRAVYLGEETKRDVLRRRLEVLAAGRGLTPSDLGDRVLFSIRNGIKLDDPKWQERIKRMCARYHPALLILDPLAALSRANEDSAQEMRLILDFLRSLEREFGCAVLLVHHVRKSRGDKESAHLGQRIRGTSAFEGWADTIIFSAAFPKDAAAEVRIEHRDAHDPEPFVIKLVEDGGRHRLVYDEGSATDVNKAGLEGKVLNALREHPAGLTNDEMQDLIGGKAQKRSEAVRALFQAGKIRKDREKRQDKKRPVTVWMLAAVPTTPAVAEPVTSLTIDGAPERSASLPFPPAGKEEQLPAQPLPAKSFPIPPLREGNGTASREAGSGSSHVEQEGRSREAQIWP